MDYSTLKHPTGYSVIAVYEGDVPTRVAVELSKGWWAIYDTYQKNWASDGNDCDVWDKSAFSENGWDKYMKRAPIWVAGGHAAAQAQEIQVSIKPDWRPWESKEAKERYFGLR